MAVTTLDDFGTETGENPSFAQTDSLTPADPTDVYEFDLDPGDIIVAGISDNADALELRGPGGELLMLSANDDLGSDATHNARVFHVADTAGQYELEVSGALGSYDVTIDAFRPAMEQRAAGSVQYLYLDFNGETIDAQAIFGEGNSSATLDPLANFLDDWGLAAADEDAVVDAIVDTVAARFDSIRSENNGNRDASGVAGQFDIEILNSRDHGDMWGLPNVSRVIVGGTMAQTGLEGRIGQSTLDVGNFNSEQTAIVHLDLLSGPNTNADSINSIALDPNAAMVDLVGTVVGNVVSHEAGHYFGNFHTVNSNSLTTVMDQGGVGVGPIAGVGDDDTFGTADDVDIEFGPDTYEDFAGGTQDSANNIAFGLSTGTGSGSFLDLLDGTLYYTAESTGATVALTTTAVTGQVRVNDGTTVATYGGLTRFVFTGGDGDDTLTVADGILLPIDADGGPGDDFLQGGRAADTIVGGAGRDTIEGGRGNDVLNGGSGDDLYTFSQSGNAGVNLGMDVVIDSGGLDQLDYLGFIADGINVRLDDGAAQWLDSGNLVGLDLASSSSIENVTGTNSDDLLIGNSLDNTLEGNGGDDTFFALGGNDVVQGASGNDTLYGNEGNDTLNGGADDDTYYFSQGSNPAYNLGMDVVIDSSGVDVLNYAGFIADGITLRLDDGSAQWLDSGNLVGLDLSSTTSIENVSGTNSDDLLIGNSLNNTLEGNGGDDTFFALDGDDVVQGESGNDTLYGNQGNDTLNGGADDDTYYFSQGSNPAYNLGMDVVIDSSGVDVLNYAGFIADGITLRLDDGSAQWLDSGNLVGLDLSSTTSIENVSGTNSDDLLIGNSLDNTLEGNGGDDTFFALGGNDVVQGASGNDTLYGNEGNDTLNGGAGDDTYYFSQGSNPAYNLGMDVVIDSSGVDVLNYAGFIADGITLHLDDGSAQWLDSGNLVGLDLSSTTSIENVSGTNSDDLLIGNSLNNTLEGNGGDDTFFALDGNDVVQGESGNDTLYGNQGNDTLNGGAGDDTYVFSQGGNSAYNLGMDVVIDSSGVDHLNYVGFVADGINVRLDDGAAQWLDSGNLVGLDLSSSSSIENVSGTNFDDLLIGNSLNNTLEGNDGDDTFFALGGNDVVQGESGNDTLYGNEGNDTLHGGAGDDTYVFSQGGNSAYNLGMDVVIDTSGVDTLDYIGFVASGINVALDTTAAQWLDNGNLVGLDLSSAASIEIIRGTNSADVLTGNNLDNVLDGGAGGDTLVGNAGVDRYFALDGEVDTIVSDALDDMFGSQLDTNDIVS